jgi:phosphatidylglycerol lysyltransferase
VVAPPVALAAAALLAVVGAAGTGAGLGSLLAVVLPIDPLAVEPLDAVAAAVAFGALALGLIRRKRMARILALATFAGALAGQALTLHHPIAAALAAGCLLLLLRDRRRYQVETDRAARPLLVGVLIAEVAILVVGSIASDVVAASAQGSPLDVVANWVAGILDFVDPTGLFDPARAGDAFEVLESMAAVAAVVAAVAVLRSVPDRPAPDLLERNRDVARRNAHGALAPFQLGADKLLFALPRREAAIAYGRAGRMAVVLGDPIGPAADAWRTFLAFVRRCERGDVAVGVYQASEEFRPCLVAAGFHCLPIGQEAIVDLTSFDLSGARRANLRHTVARCRRAGVMVRWHPAGLPAAEMAVLGPELAAIDAEWRSRRGPQLRFTIGAFVATDLGRVGVAVAIAPNGQPEGFATFRRVDTDRWVLDLLRRRPNGTPGALEACLAEAASEMRAAGDRELSLGLVALAGLRVGQGTVEARLLALAARAVRPFYDVRTLAFFKAKFDPRWEPRYAALPGALSGLPFAAGLLWLHVRPTARPGERGSRAG